MNIKLLFTSTFLFFLYFAQSQLKGTKSPNIFSYEIDNGNDYLLGLIANDSIIVVNNLGKDDSKTYTLINVNTGAIIDKLNVRDEDSYSTNLEEAVLDNDKIIFVLKRNFKKASKKFIAFYIYSISNKQLEAVEFDKKLLNINYNDFDLKDVFVDESKKNIYIISNASTILKYSTNSKEFTILQDFPLQLDKERMIYAHDDYLYFKNYHFFTDKLYDIHVYAANDFTKNKTYSDFKIEQLQPFKYDSKINSLTFRAENTEFIVNGLDMTLISKLKKDDNLLKTKCTRDDATCGFLLLSNLKNFRTDTIKFNNEIHTILSSQEKQIVLLNKNKKANCENVLYQRRADFLAKHKKDSIAAIPLAQMLGLMPKPKIDNVEPTKNATNSTISHNFFETFNVYRTFNGGEVRGDFQELKWQVRFIAKENSINQYWEKDGFPGTSFKLYETYNVIENKKTENFKYVYLINNITAIFYNTSNPTTITITKDGGKTFTEYATYDSYYKKFK